MQHILYFHLKEVSNANNILVFTERSNISIKVDNETFRINNDCMIFIEKNCILDVTLLNNHRPSLIFLSDNIMNEISKIISVIDKFAYIKSNAKKSKILIRKANQEDFILFNNIKSEFGDNIITYDKISGPQLIKITSILLGFDISELTFILRKTKLTYKDKVIAILSQDLAYDWKVSNVSDKLYISESSLRKKLENEKTSFIKLLTTTRMNHALNLLVTTDLNVNVVSFKLGYKTTSYFIKRFKEHYGITPKQFLRQRTLP
ncbi:helix-turn-helix transcriptional regulator [Salmonella enterica subsp. enterica serovar Abony]|nr:helix-turn-helix transcriptional regulator [Salmonella enterica subsp. enterica serovar Abony]